MNLSPRKIAGWIAAVCGVLCGASAAPERLLEFAPEATGVVFVLDVTALRDHAVARRILEMPAVRAAIAEYLKPDADAPDPVEVVDEALIAIASDRPVRHLPLAVLLGGGDSEALRQLMRDQGLPEDPSAELPTFRQEPIVLRELEAGTVIMTINDTGDRFLEDGDGPGSSSLRSRVNSLNADAPLALMVIETLPGMGKKAANKVDPLENVTSNLRSAYATLTRPAGEPDGLKLDATVFCSNPNELAGQSMMLGIGIGMLFHGDDFKLGEEIINALKIQPAADRVDYSITLTGAQAGRLLDFIDRQIEKQNRRHSAGR